VATILLVRHGETDWNRERRWQGHADRPLNQTGREQAQALAEQVAHDPPAAIYSSDLLRARETAEIVAARVGVAVVLDARLREVDVGEWSGLTMAEIEHSYPDGARRRVEGGTGWEQGETYEATGARILGALREIASRHDGRVLVVTHGGAMRAVWTASGDHGERPHFGNCALHPLHIEDGVVRRL
jgi:broad specificity phosphatase PhoE